MQKSALMEIVNSFTALESERFSEFLSSPYFNKNNIVIRLFDIIKKNLPVTEEDLLNKETVWKALYHGKPYNYGTMKNLIHELTQLSVNFIYLEELENTKQVRNVLTVSALSYRNADKALNSKLKQIEKTFTGKSFRDLEYVLSDYYMEMSKIFWTKWMYQKSHQLKRASEKDFLAGSATTVYSFLLYLFKMTNNITVQSSDHNYELDKNLVINLLREFGTEKIERILSSVKEYSARDYKVLSVFWDMCRSQLFDPGPEQYYKFKSSLTANAKIFSLQDLEDLLTCLVTTLFGLKESEINKYRERIDIFDIMIANKIFIQRNRILPVHLFILYAWNLFNLSDFEGIEKFTKKYGKYLTEDKRENALRFSEICLKIGEKNFAEALETLLKIGYNYSAMKIYVKHIKAICYYELNNSASFMYENDSLRNFLKSNMKVNESVKESLKHHYRMISRMFQLRSKFDIAEFKMLRKEVTESTANIDSWLLKKVNELKDK
ncbi:MAG: hypothetical protein IPG02_03375 [Ignavibacteria bacterium]|nr:hypothetical protein [Ignavibacteria bacterium]